jgi:hypothetical protein
MLLELNTEERGLVVGLLESRIREIHPEIRRSRDYKYHDGLKHDLEVLEGILNRLQESEPDVRA